MITAADLKKRVEKKLFHKSIVSTATRNPFSSQTFNEWGDAIIVEGVAETFDAIPYTNKVDEVNHQPFGDFKEGNVAILIKSGQTLDRKDKVVFNGTNYLVEEIVNYDYGNTVVAKAVRLARVA